MTAVDHQAEQIPGLWTIGQRRVGFEVKALVRDRRAFVFTVLFPLILLVIFGSVFDSDISNGVSFTQYFVAGMIASGVVYTSFQNLAISVPTEREDGTLKRLRGTPMPPGSYFLGKTGLVLVSYVLQVTMLLVVGVALFHITLPQTAFQWFTLVWVSLLGLACCTLLGLAFSVVPKNGRGASAVVSPIVLVLQFTSGVFFQFDQLLFDEPVPVQCQYHRRVGTRHCSEGNADQGQAGGGHLIFDALENLHIKHLPGCC